MNFRCHIHFYLPWLDKKICWSMWRRNFYFYFRYIKKNMIKTQAWPVRIKRLNYELLLGLWQTCKYVLTTFRLFPLNDLFCLKTSLDSISKMRFAKPKSMNTFSNWEKKKMSWKLFTTTTTKNQLICESKA